MSSIESLTSNLIRSMRKPDTADQSKAAQAGLRKEARTLSRKGQHARAAAIYAALAEQCKDDIDLPLRTAHCFQLAGDSEMAARWFLHAAEQYARVNAITQAAATLRLYHELKPAEYEGPRKIFRACMHKSDDGTALLEFLDDKERAGHKLMASELFSAFDQQSFFTLLDDMQIINLEDGEALMRMGEDATSLYFVVSGTLQGFLSLHGKRTPLGTIGAGDICGEIAYFTGGRRTAEIISNGPGSLLELSYEQLKALTHTSPELESRLEALYRSRMLVKQLSLNPLLAELDADTRLAMAEGMVQVGFQAGEIIFPEAQKSCDLYMVRKGKVAINLHARGSEQMLKTIETGGVFGEMAVILKGTRTATARAVSDCSLMKLEAARYQHIYQESPQLQALLQQRKHEQLDETQRFIRQNELSEGDDTCSILLQAIWEE
ncbi:MAG: cyclic nucleotide-binding domain-containing protein [Mariprofundaceae bacterium]